LYYVFRGVDPGGLVNVGTVCLGGGDLVERASLDRAVTRLVRRLPLPAPRLASAPPRLTLVHLPTVFWAADPQSGTPQAGTHTVHATVAGVALTLTVTGTWTFTLADGHPPTTLHNAGTAYHPGATPDPRTHPGYYTGPVGAPTGVLTTYPTRGTRTITVTVTWTPTYTVDHQLATSRLDTATLTRTTRRTLTIGEARAALTATTP
jgi:hypothetical protein